MNHKYTKLYYNVGLTANFDDMPDKEFDKLTKQINRLAKSFLKEVGTEIENEIWDGEELQPKIKVVMKEN